MKYNSALTLIESLVLVAIVAIIAGMILPPVVGPNHLFPSFTGTNQPQTNNNQIEEVPNRFTVENAVGNYELITDNKTGRQYLSRSYHGIIELRNTSQ